MTHDQIEAMTLADRVVVMNKGVIQQVGSPTEIYDRPANSFVAGFIGNPAMNLIEGQLKDGTFTAQNIEIAGLNGPDGDVILGFRAEDVSVISSSKEAQISAPLYTQELLGEATMLNLTVGDGLASVKTDKEFRAQITDQIHVSVPIKTCHLFDKKTGARLDDA